MQFVTVAGVGRFELPHARIKILCLTAWRYPIAGDEPFVIIFTSMWKFLFTGNRPLYEGTPAGFPSWLLFLNYVSLRGGTVVSKISNLCFPTHGHFEVSFPLENAVFLRDPHKKQFFVGRGAAAIMFTINLLTKLI